MRRFVLSGTFSLLILLLTGQVAFAQASASSQPPVRDPQAFALLQASATAMAASTPSDSVATGSVTLVAGSSTDQGTIRILTKGNAETAVQVQTTSGSSWAVTYSNALASRTDGTTTKSLYLEQAASSRCIYFPYPVIADLLTNPDAAFTYVGLETSGQGSLQHIQAWNTFNSNPPFQFLASFTVMDIWLDATSGLPREISFIHRDGGGSAPKIPITVFYSNYQNANGALYPYLIQQTVNGTLWATVTIQSVIFNAGLSDTNFAVAAEAN